MDGSPVWQEALREELPSGESASMSPRSTFNHNRVASNLYRAFADRLGSSACMAIAGGTDLYLTEKDRFAPREVYTCPPWTKDVPTEEEQAEAVARFRCSLNDDFDISLKDIFKGVLP